MIQYGPPGCGRARRDEAVRRESQIIEGSHPLLKEKIEWGFVSTVPKGPYSRSTHKMGDVLDKPTHMATLAKPHISFQPFGHSLWHASSVVLPKHVLDAQIITSTTLSRDYLCSVSPAGLGEMTARLYSCLYP